MIPNKRGIDKYKIFGIILEKEKEMKIYWTVSRASDRYEIWVDSKIHAENLTMDELFSMWKQLHGI